MSTITIGAIGHRFLARTDLIEAGVDVALDHIEQTFPGRTLTVISSLAEGADRLVAHRAIRRARARLVALLPFPREAYQTEFTDASQGELLWLLERAAEVIDLAGAPTRDEAFARANLYMLDRIEVLLAVWDGAEAHGRGGVGETVALARQRGLPLAWVHAGNRKPGTEVPTSLGPEQGIVTFERL